MRFPRRFAGSSLLGACGFHVTVNRAVRARRALVRNRHAGVEVLEGRTLLSVPTNILLDRNIVDENTHTDQDVLIGELSTVDADAGDAHTFQLVPGTGDDHNGWFVLEGNRLSLKAGSVLDFAEAAVLSLRVETSDGTHRFQRSLKVFVRPIDVEPPTLFAPVGVGTSGTPRFDWSDVRGAAGYELEVTAVGAASPTLQRDGIPASHFETHSPLPAGHYASRARSHYANGDVSAWSAALEFSIIAPAPLAAPDPVLSPVGRLVMQRPEFAWTAVEGAERYDVWVNDLTLRKSGVIRETHVDGTTFVPDVPLVDGHSYIWTVRAFGPLNVAGAWAEHRIFSVRLPIPKLPAPEILGPGGTVLTTRPKFAWNPVEGTHHYDLWVNDQTTGESGVIRLKNVSGTEVPALRALSEGHRYLWTVRAIDHSGIAGDWAPHRTFQVMASAPIPARPQLVGPIGFHKPLRPTFEWSAIVTAVRYDIWVNDLSTGQSGVIRQQHVPGNSFTPSADLVSGHRYIWTVRAINVFGQAGEWAEHRQFTVAENAAQASAPREVPIDDTEASLRQLDTVMAAWEEVLMA